MAKAISKSGDMTEAEFIHYQKVSTALELYASIITRTKEMVLTAFEIKSFFHDGERRLVLDVARDIFKSSVDDNTLQSIVDSMPTPDIETIAISRPPAPIHEPAPGESRTTSGTKVAGF